MNNERRKPHDPKTASRLLSVCRLDKAFRTRVCTVIATGIAFLLSGFFLPSSTETAVANGDTRTLVLFHAHRRDSIEATFRVNGHYDPAVLKQLNYFLRDWRNDDQINMDPRLFDVVWEVYRTAGATEPITVLSAYRSPETNAMLRRRSRAVAEHSQHMLGKAMDTTMPDMSMEKLREIGMRLQRGGVGYYPTANFVHLDVGSVRHWPRMSYDQLVRLFPDGKTVHIPSNGQPLARYEEARAEIEANGGMAPTLEEPKSKGFFAWLFGGGSSEDDAEEVASAASSRISQPRGSRRGAAPANIETAAIVSTNSSATPTLAERYGVRGTPAPAPVAAAAPAAPAPQQAATLAAPARSKPAEMETAAADEKPSPFGTVLPTPPRRPAELMMLAADVPLPPARPSPATMAPPVVTLASLSASDTTASIPPDTSKITAAKPQTPAKPDTIAALMSAPDAVKTPAPKATHPPLPSVITEGPDGAKPSSDSVLAYAPSAASIAAPLPGLRTAALNKTANAPSRSAASNARNAIVPARLDDSNFRSLTSTTAESQTPTQSVLGPTLTGLRAAAAIAPGTLSNRLSANYVAQFASKASNLDTDHFSGTAIQPLPSAEAALQQVARLH